MINKKVTTILSVSCLLISTYLTSDNIKNTLEINSLSIDKNISGIIRVICFKINTMLLVSNSKGSDLKLVKQNNCSDDGVLDYDFIYAKKIPSNVSGLIREIEIAGVNLIVYSGKNKPPSITVITD